jgi:hypothetical protein
MIEKAEQAIRMLSGACPHNRPDSEAPRTKGNCITCIAEAVIEATNNYVAEQIADALLIMDHPTISGKYVDSWEMFRYTRNKAVEIARSYIDE